MDEEELKTRRELFARAIGSKATLSTAQHTFEQVVALVVTITGWMRRRSGGGQPSSPRCATSARRRSRTP